MAELVYPPVLRLARTAMSALGQRLDVQGGEHLPAGGPALLVSNHVSYVDFVYCGLLARTSDRLVRFMAKSEAFAHPVGGPLLRGMKHISVDRSAGAGALRAAVRVLREGEVVGVFPEGTVSRSLVPKEFKSGPVRMAQLTGAPLVPMAVWGTQRMWTKGRPRTLSRRGLPVVLRGGEPLEVGRHDDPVAAAAELQRRVTALWEKALADYPDAPAPGETPFWLPAERGGSAPTPADAARIDLEVAAHRARQRERAAVAGSGGRRPRRRRTRGPARGARPGRPGSAA